MFRSSFVAASRAVAHGRAMSTSSTGLNVAVLGAAGGIGQPLSLLLNTSNKFAKLSLFDIVNTPGVAADVGHCNTATKVEGFVGAASLGDALEGADIVVIPAGVPRKPGMTRDDLFNTNASIVMGLAEQAAKSCPNAALCIISNPVNSTVPIVAETLRRAGAYNPRKLFGVTTLDVVRANKFVGDALNRDPAAMDVPVIGGHAGKTILPLLSQIEGANFSDSQIEALTHRIQFGGDEVVQAKDGLGSATLSMAYAGARFALSLADALSGKEVTECTFVESDKVDGLQFFSTPCRLGTDGVMSIGDVPSNITDFEAAALDAMKSELAGSIEKGIKFAKGN